MNASILKRYSWQPVYLFCVPFVYQRQCTYAFSQVAMLKKKNLHLLQTYHVTLCRLITLMFCPRSRRRPTYTLSLLGHPTTDRRIVKSGWVYMCGTKNWLRRFAHPFPNFCRERGKKFRNFSPFSISVAWFGTERHIGKLIVFQ